MVMLSSNKKGDNSNDENHILRITLWMIVGVALLFSTLLGVQIITAENQLFIEMYIAAAVFWIDVLLAI